MTRRAWLLFAAVSLLWGVPYLFIKVAVGEVPPVTVVLVRVALAASLLLPFAARQGALRGLAGRLPAVVVLSLSEITIPFVLISMGEQRISSSLAGLLIAALPMFVALLAMRFDRTERVSGLRLLGLLIGIGGVALLLGLDAGGDAGQLLGAVLVLLATLCYAASTLVVKRAFSEVPMLGVAAATTTVATLLLAVPAAVLTPARLPSVHVVLALFALGVLCTAAALVAYFALIVEAGPSRAAVITYLNPAVAVALGVAVLGEPLTPAIVLGFSLIIAGSLLATRSSAPREAQLDPDRLIRRAAPRPRGRAPG